MGTVFIGIAGSWGVEARLPAELKVMVFGVELGVSRGFFCLDLGLDSLILVHMVQGVSKYPWGLQRELDELLAFRQRFHSITHCYRQANVPTDRLSKLGAGLGSSIVNESVLQLPQLVRGDLKLDRVGFPNFRES